MAARSKARKRAVDVLYAADLRGADLLEMLGAEVEVGQPPVHEYTVRLVEGVMTVEWRARVRVAGDGWVAVVVPDGDVARRREVVGVR